MKKSMFVLLRNANKLTVWQRIFGNFKVGELDSLLDIMRCGQEQTDADISSGN